MVDDMVSLGDGTYTQLDLGTLLRIYRDARTAVQLTITGGEMIVDAIRQVYKAA